MIAWFHHLPPRHGLPVRLAMIGCAVLACLLLARPLAAQESSADEATAEEAAEAVDPVNAGRDALSRGGFNWYDRDQDELRPIDVREKNLSQGSTGGGGANVGGAAFGGLGQLLGWLALAVLIGIVGYFLIVVFLNNESNVAVTAKKKRSAESEVDRKAELPVPVNRDIDDLLAAAREAASEGNLRDAIIYLYSHQLVVLDRNRLIRLTKGKTNRQYLREALKNGTRALGGVLEQTLVAFEDVFFGDHALEPARFESCWNRLDEFDRLVEESNR